MTGKTTDTDMVHLGSLLSFRALERYGETHGYDEWLKSWTMCKEAAWLVYLLRQEADTMELFPHGKWATIQAIQNLLDAAAKETLVQRAAGRL